MPSSEVMPKYGRGQLHSGSKTGPKVTNQKQAVAIMLSEKRAEDKNGGKYPGKFMGGPMNGVANGAMGPMGVNPGQMMPQAPSPMAPMAGPMAAAGGAGMLPTTPRALAVGGIAMPGVGPMNMAKSANLAPGPMQKAGDRQMMKGPILSAVSGRTDAHQGAVPSGSYVVPADIVSGRGQGNTIAGSNIMSRMFKMGPYGTGAGTIKGSHTTAPKGMAAPKPQLSMASRGGAKSKHAHIGKPVPVNLAGGEFIIPPENLMATVHPNLDIAHKVMDKWVINERKKLRKTLGKLPGPVKD
jgi:Family of unknown function (DUF6496)